MTDDQGYGDLGVHGNPIIRTPNIDAMAKKSAVLPNFYVSPVCTPTRASLMTGRYNYRTRAIDTFRGRAMMDTSEVTVAELLKAAGYATGIFGKWHLGDCYPMRPMDQGFDDVARPSRRRHRPAERSARRRRQIHRSDPVPQWPAGADEGLLHRRLFPRRHEVGRQGAAARQAVLSLSADELPARPVRRRAAGGIRLLQAAKDLPPINIPKTAGNPIPRNMDADTQARVYAMIENIDQNVGRLLKWLDERKLADNTLVIFMTDNGRATPGYNAGMRGNKSTVYEGGIQLAVFRLLARQVAAGRRFRPHRDAHRHCADDLGNLRRGKAGRS